MRPVKVLKEKQKAGVHRHNSGQICIPGLKPRAVFTRLNLQQEPVNA